MEKIKAILVDDEPNGLAALAQKLQKHCPEVAIIKLCTHPAQAIEAIDNLQPELVLLDIEMPGMNGFNLLQRITFKNFELVFVTAYDQYALKAIKFSALDYLLKPVEVEELKSAVAKVKERLIKGRVDNGRIDFLLESLSNIPGGSKKIAVPATDGILFVKMDAIVYLEASVNYTHLHLSNQSKITASRTLKDFEELLPSSHFIRIHNSFIINREYIEKYIRGEGGQVVLTGNIILDVSKRKKHEFLAAVGRQIN